MAERVHYRVLSRQGLWRVERQGSFLGQYRTKEAAVAAARGAAKTEHSAGNLTQLTIQRSNGTWQTEWTYGADPRRFPG